MHCGMESKVEGMERKPWQSGVDAAWANRWPGAALAVFAVGMVVSYYQVAPVQHLFDSLAAFKERVGWLFPFISTVIFGALIPWIVERLRPAEQHPVPVSHLLWLSLFWAWKGAEVDGFYHIQAWLFGNDNSVLTVLKKIALDMLGYAPLWATPTTVWAYAWKDRHLTAKGYRKRDPKEPRMGFRKWCVSEVLPVQISNWAVWLPAVTAIYLLPLALQLLMQNLVLCFWSLVLIWQVRSVREAEAAA